MSHSRFSLFGALPCGMQEKIYTYLPDEGLANRVNRASNQARIHALFLDQSDRSLHLQKKLLNCWMHSDRCSISAQYIENYVINRKTFYATPLSYQLLVLALYNKLNEKGSHFLIVNDYAEELLSIKDIFTNNKAVNFFSETVALLSQVNRHKLIHACLALSSTTSSINFLVGELALYLTEEEILNILLDDALSVKLEAIFSSPHRCAFSDNLMRLGKRLSDENKVQVLHFYWRSNKTPESIFYLIFSVISSISDTTIINSIVYQDLLKEMTDEVVRVLEQKSDQMKIEFEAFSLLRAIFSISNKEEVKEKVVTLFQSKIDEKIPKVFSDSVYEVLWDNAVETGNFKKAIKVIRYFLRLTSLRWSESIEIEVVDWLINSYPKKGHRFVYTTLNKIIIKIVNENSLDRLINFFLQICQSPSRNDAMDDCFWRVFRSFLRHPSVTPSQRNNLLVAMISSVNRGTHSLYVLLVVNRLSRNERGLLFDSMLTKNIETPSVSLIDAIYRISSMPLPLDLVGGFIKRLIDFLLSRAEDDFPASLENIYLTLVNLSRQALDDDAITQLFSFLKNPLFGNKKFILLKSLLDSPYLLKCFDDIHGLLIGLLSQAPLKLDDPVLKVFEKCIYLASKTKPAILPMMLDFLIKHTEIDMFVRLSILRGITVQPLIEEVLFKCLYIVNVDFPSDSHSLARMRLDILNNLAKYSSLPKENIQRFYDEAKRLVYSTVVDDHVSGFDLVECLLYQANLPVDIQENISYLIFEALHADCSERVLPALGVLKVWHERGYSLDITMKDADQERLLALTGSEEEQIQSDAIYLINVLPQLKSRPPKFLNLASIFLMAIQEERGFMQHNSRSPANSLPGLSS